MRLKITPFVAGEDVAFYSGEVIGFGNVISIESGIAKVLIKYNVYDEDEDPSVDSAVFEYVYRDSDGLYVAIECMDEYVPSRMLANMNDIGAVNIWRYSPTLLEKFKRKFKTVGRLEYVKDPEENI